PIAEDFYELFGLGTDEKHISSLDTSGIALAAIQALNADLKKKTTQLKQLEQKNTQLADKIAQIEAKLQALLK
ncbi:MAG: hypothetical protein RPS47_00115, partial [Colwellia sp.]